MESQLRARLYLLTYRDGGQWEQLVNQVLITHQLHCGSDGCCCNFVSSFEIVPKNVALTLLYKTKTKKGLRYLNSLKSHKPRQDKKDQTRL